MNKLFFTALALLLCIGAVQATTVIGSRYITILSVGSSDNFVMELKPDTADEIGMPLVVSVDDGNCSQWITPDTKGFNLTTTGTKIKASIKVPSDAYSGENYRCAVQFTAPRSGMLTSRIEVPVKITVTGGKERPLPVAAAEPVPALPVPAAAELPSEKLTAVQTQATPVLTAVTTATTRMTVQAPQSDVRMPDIPYTSILITGLIVFAVILLYDWRRGKR